MDNDATLSLAAAGLALTIGASLGDRARRRAPLAWHAHLPWHAMIFAGMAAMLFAAIHLVTLAKSGS